MRVELASVSYELGELQPFVALHGSGYNPLSLVGPHSSPGPILSVAMREHMNKFRTYLITLVALLVSGSPGFAQAPPASAAAPSADQTKVLQSTEAFVRNLYAWGPEFKIRLGPMTPSASPDFYLVPIQGTINYQTDSGTV